MEMRQSLSTSEDVLKNKPMVGTISKSTHSCPLHIMNISMHFGEE